MGLTFLVKKYQLNSNAYLFNRKTALPETCHGLQTSFEIKTQSYNLNLNPGLRFLFRESKKTP